MNLPPSSAAVRRICAVAAETELSRSSSTAASDTGSCPGPAKRRGGTGLARSRARASTSSRRYRGLPRPERSAGAAYRGRRSEHGRHQGGHVGFGSGPSVTTAPPRRTRDARTCWTSGRRGSGRTSRSGAAAADRWRRRADADEQRCVIGPLQVIDDHDRRGGRAQLVRQRHEHLDTGNATHRRRRTARALAASRPAACARRGSGEPAGPAGSPASRSAAAARRAGPRSPTRCPAQLARSRQGLDDQGRLADAGSPSTQTTAPRHGGEPRRQQGGSGAPGCGPPTRRRSMGHIVVTYPGPEPMPIRCLPGRFVGGIALRRGFRGRQVDRPTRWLSAWTRRIVPRQLTSHRYRG